MCQSGSDPCKSSSNPLPIRKSTVNPVPSQCRFKLLIASPMSIHCKSVNRTSIKCQASPNVNPMSIWCRARVNRSPITCQPSANPSAIWRQLDVNLLIQCKSDNPWPIHQSIANPKPTRKHNTNPITTLAKLPIHYQSAILTPVLDRYTNDSFPISHHVFNTLILDLYANPPKVQSYANIQIRCQSTNSMQQGPITKRDLHTSSVIANQQNLIDTNWRHIGADHANPLPIGGHFRK